MTLRHSDLELASEWEMGKFLFQIWLLTLILNNIYIFICKYICRYMYEYMDVCVCVRIYIYIYIYIYIPVLGPVVIPGTYYADLGRSAVRFR